MKKGLLALVAVLVLATVAYADTVEVAQSIDVHQGWLQGANDIHFVVYPFEPWTGIIDWEMMITGSPPYTYTVDSVYSDYTGVWKLHWLRFDVTFARIIPYCTWITIDVKLWLDTMNAIIIDSVYWTLNGEKLNEDTEFDLPGQGFSVDNISADGRSTVWVRNQSDEVLIFSNFRLARNQSRFLPPSSLGLFTGWTDNLPPFGVMPSASYSIPVENMMPGAFLFMAWDILRPGGGFNAEEFLGRSAGVHEDQFGAFPVSVEEYGLLDEVKFLDVGVYPGYSSIHYFLPKATHANLSVYTVTGELVATLVDEEQSAGGHTVRWDGGDAPAGLYFCRLSADGIQATEKMIRLK